MLVCYPECAVAAYAPALLHAAATAGEGGIVCHMATCACVTCHAVKVWYKPVDKDIGDVASSLALALNLGGVSEWLSLRDVLSGLMWGQ